MHDAENALGDLLRARRRLVGPEESGLPLRGRRRSPGLRRDELALLAGVSSPYYIRLEQGRARHPSAPVVRALGLALRLNDDEVSYLERLAGVASNRGGAPVVGETVREGLEVLIHQLAVPAAIVGRYRDVLAANRLAEMLHVGFRPGTNLLRFLFLDPRARTRVMEWERIASTAVTRLRLDTSDHLDDAHLLAIVDDLSRRSEEFRTLWDRHELTAPNGLSIAFDNPFVGQISLRLESFVVAGAPGQTVNFVYPSPGSGDERLLRRLAALAEEAGDANTDAARLLELSVGPASTE